MAKGGGNAIGRGHELIGTAACLVCTLEIPAKLTSGGKLSLACPWCDAPIYLNKGTKAFDLAKAKVKLTAPPAADPALSSSTASAQDPGAAAAASSSSSSASAAPGAASSSSSAPPRRTFAGPLFGGSG